ncbi:DUF3043 domain-containing protein [Corynebacterium cystitidis]|uniref:DUF3043 domain-containing protein n=1 Tax=Corynebacterium cystitidis TaxID=35757 RepID=UPI00211EDB2F|nr:DUF3043 domain-containing protein [Corynebacterium cystitidis]
MKLPWQKKDDTKSGSTSLGLNDSTNPSPESTSPTNAQRPLPKGYTPPKGRPTPKRREQEIARGVVRDPNALSPAEAAQRHKELKKSMTKKEWREYKKKNREENREQNREIQRRMNEGDERFLLDRDKGDVRRYIRDWVDSRRFFTNWAMPFMIVLLIVMVLSSWFPALSVVVTGASMLLILGLFGEGLYIGKAANKAAREKFPNATDIGFGTGMYAYSRASQPRKWRTPKPQVEIGSTV